MIPLRILILSFYYPPDLAAGSFRTAALVAALRTRAPRMTLEVITTLPNRYSTFSREAQAEEGGGGLTIRRIKLPSHRSGMLDQALAFRHFARGVCRLTAGVHFDLVYATSSRLMTAALGAWISRRARAPLYLDIRDIFVDTINDVLPGALAFTMKPILSALESWTIGRAAHVNLVSPGFEPYFRYRYPGRSLSCYTNGVDEEFSGVDTGAPNSRLEGDGSITVLYAGNMGEGQGLHLILPPLAKKFGTKIRFKLIGDGGRRVQLESALLESGAKNVEVLPPMSRQALLVQYAAADVLFLHLNAYAAFDKVLPSKIFEYAALGKPIWAGVRGYPAEFLRQEVRNVAVFAPCDVAAAYESFKQLEIRSTPRPDFVEKYSRACIMKTMANDILSRATANRTV